MMDNKIKEKIAFEVIKTLISRFDSFPDDTTINRNAPFHEAFLNAFKDKLEEKVSDIPFMISLSSWLHGLNTTLGQSFFENVAHILSDGEKRKFKDCKYFEDQERIINDIITDLKNENKKPNLEEENKSIFSIKKGKLKKAPTFTADVVIIENDYIEAIELKSVRPNAGEMRGEKRKILYAKACLKQKYPNKEIRYFIGFPFDPLRDKPTEYNKQKFMKHLIEFEKYFDKKEVLLAEELWNRLSGGISNTMEEILEIINQIAKPNFLENYMFINDPENFEKDKEKYSEILEQWFLFDELEIFKNYYKLQEKNPRLINQELFKSGKYNQKRLKLLYLLDSN